MKVVVVNDNHVLKVSNEPSKELIDHCGHGVAEIKRRILQHQNGNSNICSPLKEMDEEDSDVYFKPTTLVDKENGKVFSFRTPQKNKSLTEKLESDLSIRTTTYSPRASKGSKLPESPLARSPATPKSCNGRPKRNVKSVYQTPPSKQNVRRSLINSKTKDSKNSSSTPRSFRRNVQKRINEILEESSSDDEWDSDDDDKYDPSSSSDSDSGSNASESTAVVETFETPNRRKKLSKTLLKPPRTPLRTPRRGREPKVDVDMAASSDLYFEHNSESKGSATSDHTLNKLQNPRLGPEALRSLLDSAHKTHEDEREELIQDHMTLFPHWMTLMREGFSVFLCGVGSKKQLLSTFQSHYLEDEDHVVINGFFPSLTLRAVLSTIIEDIMDRDVHPQALTDQLAIIGSRYNQKSVEGDRLYLIIHSLDGPMLRNEKAQAILSELASFKRVHLVASVDHINAALLFNGNKHSAYNPLWWDATTLAPYSEETSYENSLMVQQSGALMLSSLIHVFRSLTPNAKGIFLLLAKHQLSEIDNSNYTGLSFNELYQKCRESFLVNSDLTLRAQLTEFKDHKLIKMKKGVDGQENLIIPLNGNTLQEFLDQQQEEDLA